MKTEHLKLIQEIIKRMANNSFLLKGWCVSLVAAILAFASSGQDKANVLYISFIPVFIFWMLDGYYLWQERLYRKLYDKVRKQSDTEIDFSMNPMEFNSGRNTWVQSIFAKVNNIYYLSFLCILFLFLMYKK